MNIGILGAGISGLSLAYFLRKKWPDCQITLIEKSDHVGGVLDSISEENYFFESGPRTFYTKRSNALLGLIEELGLADEVLSYSPPFFKRYIWLDEQMQLLSFNPLRWFHSSLVRALYSAILWEWKQPRIEEDENIYQFGVRRFGRAATEEILEPLVQGAHGGRMENLSAWTVLKPFKELERDYGSITRGLRLRPRQNKDCPISKVTGSDLFTLKGGMGSLIEPLLKASGAELQLNTEVQAIENGKSLITNQGKMEFERIFSTLPLSAIADAIDHPEMAKFRGSCGTVGLITVNLGYGNKLLKKEGYGYLIPSIEREEVLGAVFDSEIFPQQNLQENQTRITYTLGGSSRPEFLGLSDEEILTRVYGCAYRHLEIEEKPPFVRVHRHPEAQIEYPPGHFDNVQRLQSALGESYAGLTLAGALLGASSMDKLIASSAMIALDA